MYDRRNHAKRLFFGGILLGNFAALYLAVVEILFLLLWRSGGLAVGAPAGFWVYDGLVVLLLGPLGGLCFGLMAAVVHLATTRIAPQRQLLPAWKARCHALLALPAVAWVASQAFQGPWASRLPAASLLAVVTGLVLLLGVYVASRVVSYGVGRLAPGYAGPAFRAVAGPILLCLAAACYLTDQLVLPRLYPFFHWSLTGLALLLAWLGAGAIHLAFGRRLRRITGRLAVPMLTGLMTLAVLTAGLWGARSVGRSNLLRAVLFERTRLASKVLDVTVWVGLLPEPRALKPAILPRRPRVVRRPRPTLRGADVMLITVDALRADRLGLFGYRPSVRGKRRSLTPRIDGVFGKGVRFLRAYSPTPRTSYAVVSLLTGRPIYSLARQGVQKRWPTLAEELSRARYRSAGFYPLAIFSIDRQRFTAYQSEHLGFEYFKFDNADIMAKQRTDQVIRFLEDHRQKRPQQPFFVWVHYFDPHEPYRRHPRVADLGSSAEARYLSEIAYVDAQIGRLVQAVRKARRPTLLVLTADHGEEFGEHGGANHGTSVFDEQVRVPLLFAGPGLPDRQVDAPVSLTRVAPTVLRLLGRPVPTLGLEREDLTSWMFDDSASGPGAYAEVGSLEMLALGHHKLVRDRRRNYISLYDLRRDPSERRPLDIDRAGPARRAARQLLAHLAARHRTLTRYTERRARWRRAAPELAAPDVELRRRSARTLLQRAQRRALSPDAAAALRRALGDKDPEVRHRALIALAADAARGGRAVDASSLLPLVNRPDLPDPMRLAAALALAAHGSPSAQPALCRLLGRLHSVDGRLAVIRALGRVDHPSLATVQTLTESLRDHELATAAMGALRRLSSRVGSSDHVIRAVEGLYWVLRHRPEHLGQRIDALSTLACIGTPGARVHLWHGLLAERETQVLAAGLGLVAHLRGVPRPWAGRFLGRATLASLATPCHGGPCELGRPLDLIIPGHRGRSGTGTGVWLLLDPPPGTVQTKTPQVRLGAQILTPKAPVPVRVERVCPGFELPRWAIRYEGAATFGSEPLRLTVTGGVGRLVGIALF